MNLMQTLDEEERTRLLGERDDPEFRPGDNVRVHFRIVEGSSERVQIFEGVCIAVRRAGLHSSFTVRKISYGEGVERVFPLASPRIVKIEKVREGGVRRAKLYYLRNRRGKSARIVEKRRNKPVFAAHATAKAEAAPLANKPKEDTAKTVMATAKNDAATPVDPAVDSTGKV